MKKIKVKIKGSDLKLKLKIIDGADGKNGRDADESLIIQEVLRKIPKPKDGKDGKNAENIDTFKLTLETSNKVMEQLLPKIPTIQQIIDNVPIIGEKVRDSLELLSGDDRLDISAIKGLDELITKGIEKYRPIFGGGSPAGALRMDGNNSPMANISWGGYKITNLADPTADQDAATKNYVDDNYVPYTGAISDVDLGTHNLTTTGTITGTSLLAGTANDNITSIVGIIPPSYGNIGGLGNRTALISITTDLAYLGSPSDIVDGLESSGTFIISAQTADGKGIVFDFVTPRLITEAISFQGILGGITYTAQMRGSPDGTNWTNIGGTFNLISPTSSSTIITTLNGNTTSYRYYQLYFVSASVTTFTYYEMRFRIDSPEPFGMLQVYKTDGTTPSDLYFQSYGGTVLVNGMMAWNGSFTATTSTLKGMWFNNSLTAHANSDFLSAVVISPTFFNGAYTTVVNNAIQTTNGSIWFDGGSSDQKTAAITPTSGGGTRFMWIPSSASLRAGGAIGTNWDEANIGNDSVAMGYGTMASGNGSLAMGIINNTTYSKITASGYGSLAMGGTNRTGTGSSRSDIISSGGGSVAIGYSSKTTSATANITASGIASVSIGYANGGTLQALNTASFALGSNLQNGLANSFAVGYSGINLLVTAGEVATLNQSTLDTEKIYLGTFTGGIDARWTYDAADWSYGTDNVIKDADGTGTLLQTSANMVTPLVIGEYYQLSYVITSWTVGTVTPSCGGTTLDAVGANGIYTRVFKASSTASLTFTPTSTSRFTIDTISLKKIIGGNLYIAGQVTSNVGIGLSPTAVLTLKAGTATAGTSPFKFTSGTLLTAPEVGAVEFLTDDWYGTITTGTARKRFVFADVGGTGGALTSTRVPYATTNGRLTDASGFTTNGTDWTFNSTTKLIFNATTEYINSANAGYLDLNAATNIRFNNTLRTATSLYRRYYHISLGSANPGASGATWVSPDANTTGGWNLTASTDVLVGETDVHSDWDGASDPKFEVRFAVNVDNTGGLVTDTVDLKMIMYYKGVGDTATKTQTVEVATVIGQSAQYKQFKVIFPLNFDEAGNVLDAGDIISFKLNIETDTSEVDNIILSDMSFSYLKTHVGLEDGDE